MAHLVMPLISASVKVALAGTNVRPGAAAAALGVEVEPDVEGPAAATVAAEEGGVGGCGVVLLEGPAPTCSKHAR